MRQRFTIDKVDHSAVILAVGPGNTTALVSEPDKPLPIYWKCPGGGGEDGETPEESAARELREEIGIVVDPEDLVLVGQPLPRGISHMKYHYLVRVSSWDGLKEFGDEGEIVRVMQIPVLNRINFLPKQWKWWDTHRDELLAHGVDLPKR